MKAYINYLIDDSCTIQDVYGKIIYGILCESENNVSGLEIHPNYADRIYHEYYTIRNADFYSFLDRSTYGKPTDITFFNKERKVYTIFLEYTGNVYITAYEQCPGDVDKPVMVRCTDNIELEFPDELKRNHNIRRFIEAKAIKDRDIASSLSNKKNQVRTCH